MLQEIQHTEANAIVDLQQNNIEIVEIIQWLTYIKL